MLIWLFPAKVPDAGYKIKNTDYYLERHRIKLLLLMDLFSKAFKTFSTRHLNLKIPGWVVRYLSANQLSLCLYLVFVQLTPIPGQSFLTPSDTFNRSRFLTLAATGTIVYGATVVGLNEVWYKGFDRTPFHFFNDWGEWNNMDKRGHLFTAYFETEISYHGLRWTGMKDRPAMWMASGMALLFQTTIEMFDAYSSGWGFSNYDMLYNLAGIGLFTIQHLSWKEQRIRMKISSWHRQYSGVPIMGQGTQSASSLKTRTDDLFGTAFFERYLKDYNAQTVWVSVSPKAFMTDSKIPSWLNLAIGYGSENLFGGFSNTWTENGVIFSAPTNQYKRYRQWYISPDIDFKNIHTNNAFLKTLLTVLNIFKMPAPALEYNSLGKWRWHWLFL